jgi:hypothetical protein
VTAAGAAVTWPGLDPALRATAVRSKSLAAVVVIVAVVAVFAGLAQTSAGQAALRRAGLVASTPGYVSLSFANPDQMLAQLFSAEALLDTSFVITNKTTATRRFSWTMTEAQHGKTRRDIASGSIVIRPGQRAMIPSNVLTDCVGGTLHLYVQLTSPREAISYAPACATGQDK